MKLRSSVLVLFLSILVGAGCVYLGFWQLDRLAQRRARNARASARLALPPRDLVAGAGGGAVEPYRRVRALARFDFAREVSLTARSRDGSPGVHLATPIVLPGSDTLVLVLRGWVYSPDAATIDFTRWREPDPGLVEGYALAFDPDSPVADASLTAPRAVRRLDHALLERRFGTPLARYYIVMTAGGTAGDSTPTRLRGPLLDEGPHLSYAMQWFLFATIFGAGGTLVWFRTTTRERAAVAAGLRTGSPRRDPPA